ncbi:MAG: type II secretion system F family protein [Actinobacteria bacterium]|nr:type II secretion system F family protein [Actinomycetota bacterium]MBL7060916.1 type II secretion system F family protein [Actinomycetota bacterium]
MNLLIVVIAVLVSVFIFLLFINFSYKKSRLIIEKIETRTGYILKKMNKTKLSEDLELLFEEQNCINIFGFKIKSSEGLFLLRVILSLSFLIFFIVFGFFLGKNFIFYSFIGAIILYFLPIEIIKSKISSKSKRIQNELPDIVDILSSLIKAGLSLNEALNYISDNYKCETSRLFKLAQIKIFEGHSKMDAYYLITRLSFCNDFKTVIKILVQAEMIGNPISKVLKDVSKVMRTNQRDLLKIRSERLESNLVLVIFIFMFIPMIFLFLLPVLPQLKMFF